MRKLGYDNYEDNIKYNMYNLLDKICSTITITKYKIN